MLARLPRSAPALTPHTLDRYGGYPEIFTNISHKFQVDFQSLKKKNQK